MNNTYYSIIEDVFEFILIFASISVRNVLQFVSKKFCNLYKIHFPKMIYLTGINEMLEIGNIELIEWAKLNNYDFYQECLINRNETK